MRCRESGGQPWLLVVVRPRREFRLSSSLVPLGTTLRSSPVEQVLRWSGWLALRGRRAIALLVTKRGYEVAGTVSMNPLAMGTGP